MQHLRPLAAVLFALAAAAALPAPAPAPVSAEGDGDSNAPPGERRQHPYLFFEAGELDKLRARFKRPPGDLYLKALKADADRLMDRDPNEEHNAHNAFPNAVQAMVWTYLLTGEREYRDRAMQWIEGDWDRRKFGEWSEMGVAAVAVAYDTLYHELTGRQRAKIKAYLERGLDQHLRNARGWLYNNPSNTVPAQCGAGGFAALALRWESPKAEQAVDMTVEKLKRYAQRCFSPDGGYIEGTLYWDFGVSHYLMFAHALQNTTGDDDLLTHPLLKKQVRFLETILGGDGLMMPFNDTQPQLYALPVMADLGTRFDHDLMLWVADHMAKLKANAREGQDARLSSRGAFTAMAALFRGSKPSPDTFPGLPTLSRLERMNWGVMRSDDAFVPKLVVGVKGSQGRLSHHKQHDLGSFILYAGGEMLLLDPGYFQGDADDHSLPLIHGKGPEHNGARIVEASEHQRQRYMVVDAAPAYGRTAQRVRRTLVMVGDDAVVLLDDLVAGEGAVRDDDGMPGWSPPPIDVDPNAIKATAQYQAAHKPDLDTQTGAATVPGHNAAVSLWTFGPDLELQIKDRDFGKSWRFRSLAENGVYDWHSLTGEYVIQPDNPLVTVLLASPKNEKPAPPKYRRNGGRIAVALPGGPEIVFKQDDDGWRFERPDGWPPEKP